MVWVTLLGVLEQNDTRAESPQHRDDRIPLLGRAREAAIGQTDALPMCNAQDTRRAVGLLCTQLWRTSTARLSPSEVYEGDSPPP
jgi:hypothetical protein